MISAKTTTKSEVIIGAFYELPCNKIAKTFSYGKTGVGYYFDDETEAKLVSAEELISTWKLRKDLNDFPNARDPRLPYSFDLFWDIKYTSELNHILSTKKHSDYDEIFKMAKETGFRS